MYNQGKSLCANFFITNKGTQQTGRDRVVQYTGFELNLAREKISSKQSERQGEIPYKRLIEFSFCLLKARCSFKRCVSFLDSIKEI